MKKLVQIPRTNETNNLLVMNFVFDEITQGFKHWGFDVQVIESLNALVDGSIVFFDDNIYKHNKALIELIAKQCPNCVCVCWYWTDLSYKPFKYMIHTGEHWLFPPKSGSMERYYIERYHTYMAAPTYVPIVYRPKENPDNIGLYPRNIQRDFCYMGAAYKRDWVPSPPEFSGIYHTGDWNKYLKYEERRDIYLSSIFALGFHDCIALESGSISARIFEGLSYGCVVLCESEFVCEYTDNIVVHIKSKEDIEEKIRYYKSNPELIREKQEQAYKWMKTKGGTNIHSCLLFLNKIKEIYDIDYLSIH